MIEIGGYIEFEKFSGNIFHGEAIALNYARNALLYLCKAKGIHKIVIPKFLCNSVSTVCKKNGILYRYYNIGLDLLPEDLKIDQDEWLYLVNYYGQLKNEQIQVLQAKYEHIIVDNVQAFFQLPVENVDTIYTCRKFFGVPDGAFLYTDALLQVELSRDESFEKMHYLLGRYERSASEFYGEYVQSERDIENAPLKLMSRLTRNLLCGIDYETVKKRRRENFQMLHKAFGSVNRLKLAVPEGAFMYPLYIADGARIRKALQQEKIYIPTLWWDVFDVCSADELEYDLAENILPLPVDQRYGKEEIKIVCDVIKGL